MKPRSDARLLNLPAAQREALRRWLEVDNISYRAAVTKLREEFGVKTSMGALSGFWQTACSNAAIAAGRPTATEKMILRHVKAIEKMVERIDDRIRKIEKRSRLRVPSKN